MAYYTLLTIQSDPASLKSLEQDDAAGETLHDLMKEAQSISWSPDGTPGISKPQKDFQASSQPVGVLRGSYYDELIVETEVPPGNIACVLRNDSADTLPLRTGKEIAGLFSKFKSAVSGRKRAFPSKDEVVPVYYNQGPLPQTVEIHKATCRLKDDPATRWEPYTDGYVHLVQV
ncbi:MAG: hypothetical protein K9G62_03955 [Alphaproteobacteria bacterium]|nr:hypothetical protein [Alphaproteobacteria bacterium]